MDFKSCDTNIAGSGRASSPLRAGRTVPCSRPFLLAGRQPQCGNRPGYVGVSRRKHGPTPGENAALREQWSRRDLTSAVSAPWPAGKHTASSHRLSALLTPAGKSYECQAQQTISLISSDHQKSVQLLLSEVRVQPFDITADFVFSEEHKCPVDQREQLEETLPLILGLILGLVIVITLCVYHIHHKLTANQVQIPRDRSQYKHMG
ncbi:PREDICTED: lysosome-associated membrane glycoprotein 5 [Aptenodytes forsteri]|uniref:lysosome-associated membrane glycoprotein 5 n=1 Tax=Aptenodytes forsteri TaxID=9233 RepID=UPI0004F46ED3|nr:PREDICTED: lysosome-associated membrane glycoprotein 5 [Aptenodytes forsteri]